MFGRKKEESLSQVTKGMEPEKESKGSGASVTGFDSSGLERAAKAAKELDASKNAKAAIELIKVQETTKQHESVSKTAEYTAMSKQLDLQRVGKEGEEARKTLEVQTQHDRGRADYRDKLDRKRLMDQLTAQKEMQEQSLKRQEEHMLKAEELRRKTLEYEAELKTRAEIARAKAEAEGRIRQERENHDLMIQRTKLEAAERREAYVLAAKNTVDSITASLANYMTDPQKIRNSIILVTAVAAGIYTTKTGAGVAGRFIEARLGKPSLVRETSRVSPTSYATDPLGSVKRLFKGSASAMDGVVLETNLSSQLNKISTSTKNTKSNNAPFRHLMLHGPPGTGKTLFAKQLAKSSNMEYAILTGGDIAPLGREGVTELHKLFDWAQTSKKGVLVFVDEADAFLRNRETEGGSMSEDSRNALNAFLYRTGSETDKFMVVYASNRPDQFDAAVTDRVDEIVEFQLPGTEERVRMLNLYVKKYLLDESGGGKKLNISGLDENDITKVADMTAGWSGREIAKLVIAWQSAAFGSDGCVLDNETLYDTVQRFGRGKELKEGWLTKARVEKLTQSKI